MSLMLSPTGGASTRWVNGTSTVSFRWVSLHICVFSDCALWVFGPLGFVSRFSGHSQSWFNVHVCINNVAAHANNTRLQNTFVLPTDVRWDWPSSLSFAVTRAVFASAEKWHALFVKGKRRAGCRRHVTRTRNSNEIAQRVTTTTTTTRTDNVCDSVWCVRLCVDTDTWLNWWTTPFPIPSFQGGVGLVTARTAAKGAVKQPGPQMLEPFVWVCLVSSVCSEWRKWSSDV